MGIRTTIRHNADGTKTKRTTITRKTIFGNIKSDVYEQRIGKPKSEKKKGLLGRLLK